MSVGREILLDCETTGLRVDAENHERSDRIVEIGCVELIDRRPTGRTFQVYINPERSVSAEVVAIHGLTEAFLKNHRPFREVAHEILDFLQDSPLVIHNAAFDTKFLAYELGKCGLPALTNPIVDTLHVARKMFPGMPASLDALCRRFQIDNSARTKHGALIDAQLLSQIYIELTGGVQPQLAFQTVEAKAEEVRKASSRPTYARRPAVKLTAEEVAVRVRPLVS